MSQILDCAAPVTSELVKQVKQAGYVGFGRYINPNSFKTLTPAEVKLITDSGLSIVSIWEGNPTYAGYFTEQQGVIDAQNAVKAAQSLGQPLGTVIYLTCDYDAQRSDYNAIQAYINGALQHIAPYELGFYAGYDVVSIVQGVKYLWQTLAWSHGAKFGGINLYQRFNDVTLFGHAFDVDDVIQNPGWWPTPKETSNMPGIQLQVGSSGVLVKEIQQEINGHGYGHLDGGPLTVDGQFGPATEKGVKWFQGKAGLTVDGIVGPDTYVALDKPFPAAPAPKPAPTPAPVETHNYTLVVYENDSAAAGEWVTISVETKDNGKPLGNQTVYIFENGQQSAQALTDATTGGYGWGIQESSAKTDTMEFKWTDPAGVLHTVTKTTTFTVPQTTDAPVPSDDNVVVRIPMLPDSDPSNAIFFNITAPNGQDIKVQLDTGAFELMFTSDSAKTLGLANEGALSVQGVGGSASAYYSHSTFSIGGVQFAQVPCVVEDSFQGLPLFGYKFFVDNGYDLLISQKHNQIVVMKGAN